MRRNARRVSNERALIGDAAAPPDAFAHIGIPLCPNTNRKWTGDRISPPGSPAAAPSSLSSVRCVLHKIGGRSSACLRLRSASAIFPTSSKVSNPHRETLRKIRCSRMSLSRKLRGEYPGLLSLICRESRRKKKKERSKVKKGRVSGL